MSVSFNPIGSWLLLSPLALGVVSFSLYIYFQRAAGEFGRLAVRLRLPADPGDGLLPLRGRAAVAAAPPRSRSSTPRSSS